MTLLQRVRRILPTLCSRPAVSAPGPCDRICCRSW